MNSRWRLWNALCAAVVAGVLLASPVQGRTDQCYYVYEPYHIDYDCPETAWGAAVKCIYELCEMDPDNCEWCVPGPYMECTENPQLPNWLECDYHGNIS